MNVSLFLLVFFLLFAFCFKQQHNWYVFVSYYFHPLFSCSTVTMMYISSLTLFPYIYLCVIYIQIFCTLCFTNERSKKEKNSIFRLILLCGFIFSLSKIFCCSLLTQFLFIVCVSVAIRLFKIIFQSFFFL